MQRTEDDRVTVDTDRPGLTILLTGLPAAGKSTLAKSLVARLVRTGRKVTLLDGDQLRDFLWPELGFTRHDRVSQCRRVGFIAGEIALHGGTTVCALVEPFDEAREEIRRQASAHGRFVLVHVATPLEVCSLRDPKGLYARARAGSIANLTGVGDEYEAPDNADFVIDMTSATSEDTAEMICARLFSGA